MNIISAVAIYLLDLCFSISCLLLPFTRADNTSLQSVGEAFRPITLSGTVIAVDPTGWSRDDCNVLVFLQGITARDGSANIYLAEGHYVNYLEGYKTAHPEQAFEAFTGTVWDLAERFAPEIPGRGYVVYTPPGEGGNPGINMAATIAAAEGWLGVPDGCQGKAEAAGLVLKCDLREMPGGFAEQQQAIFDEYRDRLSNTLVVHQPPGNARLRDFAIAQRAFCFYGNHSGGAAEYAREQRLYRDVFARMKPNTGVFGVWGPAGEIPFVRKVSQAGLHMLPADHMVNGSALMGFSAATPLRQPYENRDIAAQPGKHYAALMLSDGDNLQWLLGDAFYRGFIPDRIRSGDTFPLSFTYAPLMAELFPFAAQTHYGMLQPGMQLICGVSGLGYANMTIAPAGVREDYARLTAQAMQKAGLHVMQLLDDVTVPIPGIRWRMPLLDQKAKSVIGAFAAREEIAGGIWYMDPDKYQSGSDKFYSANGKAWACNRISFWSPDGTPATATPEWIQGVADTINAYPRDHGRPEGYSVINIHPWSIGYAGVQALVSLLDEDVVLLSAQELLALMARELI